MNRDQNNNYNRMLYAGFCLALLALVWANSTTPTIARDDPPRDTPMATVSATAGLSPTATPTPTATRQTEAKPRVFLPVSLRSAVWQRIGGPPPEQVNLFYEVAVCGQFALVGTNVGLYSLSDVNDDKATWQPESDFDNGGSPIVSGVAFVPGANCATAYATSRVNGVWQGSHAGNGWTWSRVGGGVDQGYVVLVNGTKLLATGNFGIAQTTLPTSGNSVWQPANQINTPTYGLNVSATHNTPVVYAAVWNRGIFEQSVSDNRQWTEIGGNSVPSRLVYDVAVNETGVIVAGTDNGLMRWDSTSGAWATTAGEYSNVTFSMLAAGPRFYAGQIGHGVLYSPNGASWANISDGLPVDANFRVRGLSFNDDKTALYAATTTGVYVWSQTP